MRARRSTCLNPVDPVNPVKDIFSAIRAIVGRALGVGRVAAVAAGAAPIARSGAQSRIAVATARAISPSRYWPTPNTDSQRRSFHRPCIRTRRPLWAAGSCLDEPRAEARGRPRLSTSFRSWLIAGSIGHWAFGRWFTLNRGVRRMRAARVSKRSAQRAGTGGTAQSGARRPQPPGTQNMRPDDRLLTRAARGGRSTRIHSEPVPRSQISDCRSQTAPRQAAGGNRAALRCLNCGPRTLTPSRR
jgi:hypothetical protein